MIVQLVLLRTLPYSKASMRSVGIEEALHPEDPLMLGDLSWHPERFVAAPQLEPIRKIAHQECPGAVAFTLASCLSNLFARKFPHGTPTHELFDRQFDPTAVWNEHLAGAPGHCVSRSGMLAMALLATGTPARVAQLVGSRGHNVIEVWTPETGWRVVDPSFAGTVEATGGRASAVGLTTAPFNARWTAVPAAVPVQGIDQNEAFNEYNEHRLSTTSIVYPEPWLYTRIGDSQAQWPLLGRFVVVGPTSVKLGLGQRLLQIGIALCGLGLVAVLFGLTLGSTRARAGQWAVEAPAVDRSIV